MKTFLAILLVAAACNSRADTNTNPYLLLATNAPQAVAMTTQLKQEKSGDFAFDRAFISTKSTRFAFLVPQNYALGESQGSVLILRHRTTNSHLTVRLRSSVECDSMECFKNECRGQLLSEFEHGKIADESTTTVNDRESPVFDLDCPPRGLEAYRVRAVFTKIRGDTLEVTLTTSVPDFKATKYDLNTLLLTFREADASGKLTVIPLSNNF